MNSPVYETTSRPKRVRSAAARAIAAEPAERVLLSVKDAASYVGVSEKTIRRYIDEGRLRAHRFGPKLLRIEPVDLFSMMSPAHPAYA